MATPQTPQKAPPGHPLAPVLTRIAVSLERIAASMAQTDPTQAYREAMTAVVDVAKTAIAPTPNQYDGLLAGEADAKPQFEDPEDTADPNEVWLGPEFVREVGAIYDPSSDDPFGLPGIKAVEG